MFFNHDGFAKKFHLSKMGKKKKEWSLEKSQKKFYVTTCLLMKYLLPKWQGNVLGHIFGTTIYLEQPSMYWVLIFFLIFGTMVGNNMMDDFFFIGTT